MKGVSQAILSKGYVTTRVLVPEQDLTSSTLKLALIPGVIGDIRFSEPDLWGTWRLPSRAAPANCRTYSMAKTNSLANVPSIGVVNCRRRWEVAGRRSTSVRTMVGCTVHPRRACLVRNWLARRWACGAGSELRNSVALPTTYS